MADGSAIPDLLAIWPQGVIGVSVFGLVILALRVAYSQRGLTEKSDKRYDDEVAAHKATQKLLDEERDRRRKIEDEMSDVKAEVRALRREVAALRRQLDGTAS